MVSENGRTNRRRTLWLVVAVVAIGLIVLLVTLLPRPAGPPDPEIPPGEQVKKGGTRTGPVEPEPVQLSPDESRELVQRKNVANGHLENENLTEAAAEFKLLKEQLPTELLPVQNLAIAYLLAFNALSPAQQQQQEQQAPSDPLAQTQRALFGSIEAAREAALSAANELIAKAPRSPAGYWFAAQVQTRGIDSIANADQRRRRQEEVIEYLQKAMEADPASPVYPYHLFEVTRESEGPQLQSLGRNALEEAYRRNPDNLALIRTRLELQLRTQDPNLVQTLERVQEVTAPFAAPGSQLPQFTQQALEAARAGDWARITRFARPVFNLLGPLQREDLDRRLKPHPLAYIQHDFSQAYYDRNPPAELPEPPSIEVTFEPFSQALPETNGAVDFYLADMDLDGTTDLVTLEPQQVRIVHRPAAEGGWEVLTEIPVPEGMHGVLALDLFHGDNPAAPKKLKTVEPGETPQPEGTLVESNEHNVYPGILVWGEAGLRLLRRASGDLDGQSAPAEFVPVEQAEAIQTITGISTLAPIDIEQDGDLDLVLATPQGLRILANSGDMTFSESTQWSTLPPAELPVTRLVALDWDRDVDLDMLVIGSAAGASGILENQRHGRVRWRSFERDLAELAPARDLVVLEADGNASWDVVTAGSEGLKIGLTTTPSVGQVHPRQLQAIADAAFLGVREWDYDNDGFRDLLAWNESGLQVLRGRDEAQFESVDQLFREPPAAIDQVDIADLDGDGDLDVGLLADGQISLFSNEGGNQHYWLSIRIRGRDDESVTGRVNHYGLGSLVEVRTASRYQAQVVQRPSTHFGLGIQNQADVARMLLTHGVPQSVVEPDANQVLNELMILKGSCPFLYTWTGERYEFFTDLLWAAPIGLQVAEGVLAPSRPWEYLKIPGESLQLKDGRYSLQITEELWEAGYFDQVELIAVDHPAEVEIYSNEKVGPPEIAELKVHTVRQPRRPVAARDQQGRDVLPLIAQQDRRYMQGWQHRYCQGRVEPHYLELDLGSLDNPRQITLFLTGWILPTDTSLNVALSQDPHLDGPQLPSVWVPDEHGNWQETVAYMGFPGGKPKTIAVDLSRAFLTDDYRLQIRTSAEIYWDEVFYTIDEEPAPIRMTPLKLASADLHYRGFSSYLPRTSDQPHWLDYSEVDRAPKWPPMQGHFTRYGDVQPLLVQTDDLMVVMSSGDEMTVEFEPPAEPLPSGWKRDFLLHNVGWDKDADLNTVYGQTSEPLPFVEMKAYPYEPDQTYPTTPRHQQYLDEYQTRTVPWGDFWRQLESGW